MAHHHCHGGDGHGGDGHGHGGHDHHDHGEDPAVKFRYELTDAQFIRRSTPC